MTTIAYKDGVMACDSDVTTTAMNYRGLSVDKIYCTKGGLVGIGGSCDETQLTEEFFSSIEDPVDIKKQVKKLAKAAEKEDYSMLFVFRNSPNTIYFCDVFEGRITGHHSSTLVDGGCVSIGSGAEFAMGAMAAGWSATGSIEIASMFDLRTGGDIQEFILDET